ncbi:MAG TPA: type I-E CRISPR-associated protein Cas7/Cse4/CasC [Balneolaceae bacterium]|nr:type I-E CRISPR-associated protein Cas7/Cse4/CasC [Balneolaceae bacterium]
MNTPKFLQIHTLTSYPGTLLNRDDAGFAKRLPFGGTSRTRISSQCLKYHWRNFDGENALKNIIDSEKTFRSRETFKIKIANHLIEEERLPKSLVYAATGSIQVLLLNQTKHLDSYDKLKKSSFEDFFKQNNPDFLNTEQVTIFGWPEIKELRKVIRNEIKNLQNDFGQINEVENTDDLLNKAFIEFKEYFKKTGKKSDIKENLEGLKLASGLDAAMFGRMVTSDVLARGDAAIHVAHAFTTHEEESESDYFTAVDELRRDLPEESGELGSGHINSTELSSGLFYTYVVVDIPLLVSNLQGVSREDWQEADKSLAAEVTNRFIKLIATVSPGAKLGSTAPYSYAQCLLVESGTAQPRTLANAFQQAVSKNGDGVLSNSYQAVASHLAEMDQMYGNSNERKLSAMGPKKIFLDKTDISEITPVPEVAKWTSEQVKGN